MKIEDVKWNDGPPPAKGWWVAGKTKRTDCRRFWDGAVWSLPVYSESYDPSIERLAVTPALIQGDIKWTDYLPPGASASRMDPCWAYKPDLCVDEGCPQHGTAHVCIDSTRDGTSGSSRDSAPGERDLARAQYQNEDIQVDDDAKVSVIDDSVNVWVQGWLYVRKK